MPSKYADGIANYADPDQTALLLWEKSIPVYIVQDCLFKVVTSIFNIIPPI